MLMGSLVMRPDRPARDVRDRSVERKLVFPGIQLFLETTIYMGSQPIFA